MVIFVRDASVLPLTHPKPVCFTQLNDRGRTISATWLRLPLPGLTFFLDFSCRSAAAGMQSRSRYPIAQPGTNSACLTSRRSACAFHTWRPQPSQCSGLPAAYRRRWSFTILKLAPTRDSDISSAMAILRREPSSMALLALGLPVIVIRRWRAATRAA